ncbi:MAG: CAAX amino terminal protease family [Rhodobacteraceae bacterium HLUCCA12]|nr:MAG: CAAX amino terminal protease family [Rhodobacteraceae bacterium HLUCCA12]
MGLTERVAVFPTTFDNFVAPARAYPQIWRLVLGLGLIAGIYFLWMAVMGGLLWLASGLDGLEARLQTIAQGADPVSLLLLLCTFLGMALGAWAAARLLHGRGWRSLFGPPPTVLRDFVLGLGVMVVVGGGLGLLSLPFLPTLSVATPLPTWLAFLPLALMGIALQTGAEELVFRGYLQQQLAARFAAPLVWMGVPSILFGLAHFAPGELGDNAWLVVAATGLFGLIAADLTARTGALGLAWGLHFANNFLAILVVSAMGGLDGLALFELPRGTVQSANLRPILLADMALMVAVWAVCRLLLMRR